MNKNKKICIGRIAAPHGIKGLVKILPYGEDPSLLEQVSDFNITLKNPSGKYILATIEGVNSREDAEDLKGTELLIDRSALPDPEDGEFYYEDLIGMHAVDEHGENIGTVKAVENYGAGDLLDITLSATGQNVLIPFDDHYVIEVSETITLQNYEVFLN